MENELDDEDYENEDRDQELEISGKRSKRNHDKSKRKRKHKKKSKESSGLDKFFDVIADEEDSDENEIDQEAELGRAEAERREKELYERRDRQRSKIEAVIREEEDYKEYIEDLERAGQPVDSMIGQENSTLARQMNLPVAKDPSLWFVKCKKGSEKLACVSLMNKAAAKARQHQPLLILSVTYLSNLKGHIYVEAYKEAHVRQAVEGLQVISNKVTLVPQNEMSEIYNIAPPQKVNIKKGDWIRIKSGTYSGDLALVVYVNNQMTKTRVKIVPRLEAPGTEIEKPKPGKKAVISRPPQRLFNNVEWNCSEVRDDPQTGMRFYVYLEMYFRKGFLYRDFNVKQLKTEDVKPSLPELQIFESEPNEEDAEGFGDDEKIDLASVKEKLNPGIIKGDKVVVTKGELTGLKGVVMSIDDGLITIATIPNKITRQLKFPATDLEKFFQAGDFVRVARGHNQGDSGLITAVDKGIVYIFSDTTKQQIEVRANDIQSGMDRQPSIAVSHNYRVNDLIIFNNNKSAGVVLAAMRDVVSVIDSYGEVRTIRLQDINSRRDSKMIPALDSMRNSITAGDSIRIIDGENKGKKGTIVHIYKDYVFLYNAEQTTNNGLFLEKRRNLLILGAELLRGSRYPKEKQSKERVINPRRDELCGKLVRIDAGPYKGYQGIVADVDKLSVKVELSSKPKTVKVERDMVKLASERPDEEMPEHYDIVTKTPAYFPQSPHWIANTPAPQSADYGDAARIWCDDNNN